MQRAEASQEDLPFVTSAATVGNCQSGKQIGSFSQIYLVKLQELRFIDFVGQ
ncbi:hypothetical protein Barb7_02863 [Bacteroidales bacterium Barb7]|nr:hypothetical protein Barb7_02863 [Bacteroidales bacterium Barb7]